ncbi:MAG: hypothetical protein J6T57_03985 [Alphaproteobacteria bacterium]|nr:hypothetical protein [Alphaproteobacteria bacterium]
MKRLAMFLGGLLVLPAFGEVAPVFYDEMIEYADTEYPGEYEDFDEEIAEDIDTESAQTSDKTAKKPVQISRQPVATRSVANRGTSTRAAPASSGSNATTSGRGNSTGNSSRVVASRATTNSRGNAARTVTSRTTTTGATRTDTSATRAAATRATGGASRSATTARTGTVAAAGTKSATSARTATTAGARAATTRAATTATARVLTESGSLYNRTSVRGSSTARRLPTIRVGSSTGITTEAETGIVAADTSEMDALAELTDYCKAQYAACMDNYCNVLDDNQGRCSCSANLKNYAKAEAALKQATEDLQDVAQKIQYIGLTAREVETLFTQTEAEAKMQSSPDNSQLKTSLDKIKDMIIEVKSGNASSTSSGLSFDLSGLLDFSIDSTGFDLSSFLGGLTGSGKDVSNQRGAELYKTASNRCKANVLKSCTAQGVDASLITNAYDLEIDKECIAYERSLNDSNDQMTATVRNAQGVLQKARLMVAQSKNEYDMRGCISALDACMQDEFVCGTDYEKCLDPTGRYIVDGKIVVGSQPGRAIEPSTSLTSAVMNSNVCKINLYRTWDFGENSCQGVIYDGTSDQGNAWGTGPNDTLAKYVDATVVSGASHDASVNMSKYLQNKIGYVSGDKNFGMCVGVLNKCQDYTYTGRGNNLSYNETNDVIKQYLNRILIQIKAKQDAVLADYAESCITDVNSCLAQNSYPTEEPGDGIGNDNWTAVQMTQANIAINACRSQIITCMSVNGYSIDTPTPSEMNCWVMGLQFNTTTNECAAAYSRAETATADGETSSGGTVEWYVRGDCPTSNWGSGQDDYIGSCEGDYSSASTEVSCVGGTLQTDGGRLAMTYAEPSTPTDNNSTEFSCTGYKFYGWKINGGSCLNQHVFDLSRYSGRVVMKGCWVRDVDAGDVANWVPIEL